MKNATASVESQTRKLLAYNSCYIKHEMVKLEKDISIIQNSLIHQNDVNLQKDLSQKK